MIKWILMFKTEVRVFLFGGLPADSIALHWSAYISVFRSTAFVIWAASWQNQQNGCAPSEDSDQPGHPLSLIRVFAVRMKKARVLSYPLSAQQRLWSDLADAQADLSLRWTHSHFVGFVMSRLFYNFVLHLPTHLSWTRKQLFTSLQAG